MRKRIPVIAGAVAAAMTVATIGAQRADELIVSYAYDGRLLPVGRYDGTRWINTWPDPIENNKPRPQSQTTVRSRRSSI